MMRHLLLGAKETDFFCERLPDFFMLEDELEGMQTWRR